MLLCSFQKEESVLLDELLRLDQGTARGADRDDRHRRAVRGDAADLAGVRGALRRRDRGARREQPGEPWSGPEHCCSVAKVAALERALGGAEGWITGIRREQGPTRADAELIERDEQRGLWKYNPLAHWTDKDLWRRIHERDLPYNPLHDQGYESIGCAPCTQPGQRPRGPLGRAPTRPSAALHVEIAECHAVGVACSASTR